MIWIGRAIHPYPPLPPRVYMCAQVEQGHTKKRKARQPEHGHYTRYKASPSTQGSQR